MINKSRIAYYRHLADGTSSRRPAIVVLSGGPGWGKTRTLLEVKSLLSGIDETLPIYLPLDTLCFSPEFFISHAVRTIGEQAGKKSATLGEHFISIAGRRITTVLDVFKSIAELTSVEDFRLVLLLDEIGDLTVLKSFPGSAGVVDGFYEFLQGGNFGVLATTAFPGKIALMDKISKKTVEFVEIPLLDIQEIALMVRKKGLSAGSAPLIHTFTGGVPGYVATVLDHIADSGSSNVVDDLVALMRPDSALELKCRYNYEYLVQRSRGEGIVRHLLSVLAFMERPKLTEIAEVLGRSLGVTKDYLKWLLAVGLIEVEDKRYSICDGLLSLWIQLYRSGWWPNEDIIRQKVGDFVKETGFPQPEVKSPKPTIRKKRTPAPAPPESEESPAIILPRKQDIEIEELD